MSSIALYTNNSTSTLAGAITNTSLSANLASGGGALFPHPVAGQYFALTFIDAATGLDTEIVWVTNVTGDTVTIIRAQEGTIAQNWSAGDIAAALITAGDLQQFVQFPQMQQFSTNVGVDTGGPNAYSVALTPALTAHNPGSPIFWKAGAGNANTGASTFNDGAGALPLVNPDGTALGSGTITGNGYYISVADGAGHFQLLSASDEALSSQGIATTGDMKFRPTSETIPGWVTANGLTLGNPTSGATGRANNDTLNLFTWHWVNFSNAQCPVSPGGHGASAAADFAANKTIQALAWQGIGPVGVDTMGGAATTLLSGAPVVSGSTTAPGSVLGENLHTLSLAQLPTGITSANTASIALSVTQTDFSIHSPSNGLASAVGGGAVSGMIIANGAVSGQIVSTGNIAIGSGAVTSNNTGATAFNLVQRSMGVYWYLKL